MAQKTGQDGQESTKNHQKQLCNDLEAAGRQLSVSTVRCVRKKLLIQTWHLKAGLKFAADHRDKVKTFWRKTLWSHETDIELFGHNEQQYVWRRGGEAFHPKDTTPTVRHGAGSITLWGCSAVSGSAALKKLNGIMKKEDYLQIFRKTSNHQQTGSWVQLGVSTGQWSQHSSQVVKEWIKQAELRFWSGPPKVKLNWLLNQTSLMFLCQGSLCSTQSIVETWEWWKCSSTSGCRLVTTAVCSVSNTFECKKGLGLGKTNKHNILLLLLLLLVVVVVVV